MSFMRRALFSLFGLLLAAMPSALACEGCKEPTSVNGGGGVDGISAGFSASVLFMLMVVGSLIAGFIWMIVRSCRQLESAHRETAAISD
jgi:hypothetical protein